MGNSLEDIQAFLFLLADEEVGIVVPVISSSVIASAWAWPFEVSAIVHRHLPRQMVYKTGW